LKTKPGTFDVVHSLVFQAVEGLMLLILSSTAYVLKLLKMFFQIFSFIQISIVVQRIKIFLPCPDYLC
jgi:hypothetical protein